MTPERLAEIEARANAARSDVPELVARVKDLEAELHLSHEVNVKHGIVCGEAIDQRDEAEARLAIAVEALMHIAKDGERADWLATAALAKIRGETKEP